MNLIQKNPWKMSKVRGVHTYFNDPDYFIYNANNTPKLTIGDVFDNDGTNLGPSVATKLGVTNIIQQGDLPTLRGTIVPTKYWATAVDGKPKLMGPGARDTIDAQEASKVAKNARMALLETKMAKRTRRQAVQSIFGDGDMNETERDELIAK